MTDEQKRKAAAQSILDDYLLSDCLYPPRGGRECVSIGDFLLPELDDDDLSNALAALVAGDPERRLTVADRLRGRCDVVSVSAWLEDKHPLLIERRMDELDEEERERMEVSA